ncbi:hypothetical protein BCR35DRAFT_306164 [Leucosporidium creatinivorum]|uniref:Zn(2)-C6 fungal-type domain-containing protein n=1 Tax=Leucosporidium creatinivorum TaxID=106004 RepID=A0A1Y2EVY1_9BASI|nr:hypothetical protein BCR35DRAFT_306164 [Leucosporidium creatinivorum]
MRHSSTKGKHIHLQEPALPKGLACSECKRRKVRCDAVKPACGSCRRTARFEGRDETEVVCEYLPGRKCGTRRRRKASTEVKEEATPPPEPTEALPFALPALDGQFEHYPSAALLLMNHNHLSRTETNSSDWSDYSARSGDVGSQGSSSASTAYTTPSPTSPKSFDPLDALDSTFSTLSFPFAPIPAPSTLPLPPLPSLDSTSYFDALNFAPSTTTTSTSVSEPSTALPTQYPSFDPFSLFALPSATPAAPSTAGYFDLPPVEQQAWLGGAQTSGLDFDWSMGAMSGMPFTPGVLDWEALATATA